MSRASKFAVIGGAISLAALAFSVMPGGADEKSDSGPAPADARPNTGTATAPRARPRARDDDLPIGHAILTKGENSVEDKIIASLDKPTTVDFSETPLEDALQFLKDYHDINVWIDRGTLTEDGIALDFPVTLKLAGVRLESVLNLLLDPHEMDWVIQDEVLKITTKEWAAEHPEVRAYSVQNLVDAGHTPEDLIASITQSVEPRSWQKTAGISHSGAVLIVRQSQRAHGEIARLLAELDDIADADEDEREANRKKDLVSVKVYQTGRQPADKVAECLTELVARQSWATQGGKGKVRALEQAIVVEQTREVHQEIDRFLKQLAPKPVDVAQVRAPLPGTLNPPGALPGPGAADPFRMLPPPGGIRPGTRRSK